MSSPPKSSHSPTKGTVHQKLSSVLHSHGSSRPFIKTKSQTTSSIVFPSFRFSPESEEIQEVHAQTQEEAEGGSGEGEDQPPPDTPPATSTSSNAKSGGDISPLKEYIMKHKWANKWEKRSLSLDLDLKGKIFTALEDKRKSFVSQFLNEEDESAASSSLAFDLDPPITPLTTSCSIPEQLVVGGNSDSHDNDLSISSDTVLFRSGSEKGSRRKNRARTLNLDEENCTDYFDYEDYEDDEFHVIIREGSSINSLEIPSIGGVEEIGVDCCDESSMIAGGIFNNPNMELLKDFVLQEESLKETFEGIPPLYNPPSVVLGIRKFPIQEKETVPGVSITDELTMSEEVQDEASQIEKDDYSFAGLLRNISSDIMYHPLVKYWVGLFAAVLVIPFGAGIGHLIWFLLGIGGSIIFGRGLLWRAEDEATERPNAGGSNGSNSFMNLLGRNVDDLGADRKRKNSLGSAGKVKSQGWLLALNSPELTSNNSSKNSSYPPYNPFNTHLRDTKAVFARLDSSVLTLSVPHPSNKHRVPKRRLWSDPSLDQLLFVRHFQYDLSNAKVEIVPNGLAKKRVWCKKYPIAITLRVGEKYCGVLSSSATGSGENISGSSGAGRDSPTTEVMFSKDDKGNERVKVGSSLLLENAKGDVFKDEENCAGKTIYLFCRCDREKDDWFRRLVLATKQSKTKSPASSTPPSFTSISTSHNFLHFLNFMHRACPSMIISQSLFSTETSATPPIVGGTTNSSSSSPRNTPVNELLSEKDDPQTSTASQPSSLKSSPDKLESFNFIPEVVMNPTFLNALLGRLFYDFLQSDHWNNKVKRAIDRKLFFIKKPAVVQSLKVKSLEFGEALPIINHASVPVLDKQGLWVDLDVGFSGSSVVITLEAFINPLRLGSNVVVEERVNADLPGNSKGVGLEKGDNSRSPSKSPTRHAMFDSDADDSGESSESEDDTSAELEDLDSSSKPKTKQSSSSSADSKQQHQSSSSSTPSTISTTTIGGRGGKLLRYADSFAKSSVMKNKHVQKVVTAISTTPVLLTVEIMKVEGSVALNVPPVPSDRVWLGFRSNPVIDINVRPKVGQRVVSLTHVTEWIKRKILLEFQRVMVCPNMIDITIPLMEFQLPK